MNNDWGVLVNENRRLIAENERLKDALGAVEWVWRTNSGKNYCPWCFRLEKDNHTLSCARQAALAPKEREESEKGEAIEVTPEIAQAISAGCDAFAGFLQRLIAGDLDEPLKEFDALIRQKAEERGVIVAPGEPVTEPIGYVDTE